jgi:Predicted nucleic acid-binding protein, contains PIN domain
MPLSEIDFGKSIVPLVEGEDAFFIDTNVLVAYFYENDIKHLPCFLLITYLIKNEKMLCTSEIVIVELINSLARVLYIDDKLTEYILANPDDTKPKKQEFRFKIDWSRKIIKQEPEILKKYNSLAISKIETFVKEMVLFECTASVVDDIFELMTDTSVASADAMILATAINNGLPYIISVDKDMHVNDSIDILYTEIKNEDYDYKDMIGKLEIKDYLLERIGEIEFKNKFSGII